jgi:hypothetical protein
LPVSSPKCSNCMGMMTIWLRLVMPSIQTAFAPHLAGCIKRWVECCRLRCRMQCPAAEGHRNEA